MVFSVVMYGCESWTVNKAECWKINGFELWCWRRLLRVPCTTRRSNQSILKEISPGCSLEGLMLKLKLQYFGHLMRRVDSLEKTLMLGGKGPQAGGEGDNRGWDGWMASSTWWAWVWGNSGSLWWTGRPGVLRFMDSQRVGHDWVTEITELNRYLLAVFSGLEFKTQHCNLLGYSLSLQSSWDKCVCWVFFSHSFWIILFFCLLSIITYKRHQKRKSLVNQNLVTYQYITNIYLFTVVSICSSPVLYPCLRAQSSSIPHFLSIFVHSPSYPHTFLSTALDKICAIHHVIQVGSAIRWERLLLSSPYASGKSPWLQPPLRKHSYHVLRPYPAAFILIPVSRLKIEHCSFLVSQCMRFCCFPF